MIPYFSIPKIYKKYGDFRPPFSDRRATFLGDVEIAYPQKATETTPTSLEILHVLIQYLADFVDGIDYQFVHPSGKANYKDDHLWGVMQYTKMSENLETADVVIKSVKEQRHPLTFFILVVKQNNIVSILLEWQSAKYKDEKRENHTHTLDDFNWEQVMEVRDDFERVMIHVVSVYLRQNKNWR